MAARIVWLKSVSMMTLTWAFRDHVGKFGNVGGYSQGGSCALTVGIEGVIKQTMPTQRRGMRNLPEGVGISIPPFLRLAESSDGVA